MGVFCKINLFKPSDGAYTPGSNVSGVIHYGVDETTVFDKITVSLKGHGFLTIHEKNSSDKSNHIYTNREVYADIDNVVDNEKKIPHEVGMYEARFDFKLPDNIPPTLHYRGWDVGDRVECDIVYYIRIKLEKSGFLQFAKRFKKELTVVSKIRPTLPTEPIMYGERKKLIQPFSFKKSVVNIKASIKNSVIPIGGDIEVDYEVANDTNLTIKTVETKLVEKYTFKSTKDVYLYKDVRYTDSKTGAINREKKVNLDSVINVPSHISTLGFSKIASRDYLVRIMAVLPFPHINAVLDIPVEIGDLLDEIGLGKEAIEGAGIGTPDFDNPPPSYWEVMGEEEYHGGKSWKF